MSDFRDKPDLGTWKSKRADGSWETYWRAGYVVKGQPALIVDQYCRRENHALQVAEDAAKIHHKALEDLGMFVRVDAFVQKWRTRPQGNLDEFDAAVMSTRIVLNPQTDMSPSEAVRRARERADRIEATDE